MANSMGGSANVKKSPNINKGVIMMCSKDWEYQEFVVKGKEYDKYRRLWWGKVEQYYKSC